MKKTAKKPKPIASKMRIIKDKLISKIRAGRKTVFKRQVSESAPAPARAPKTLIKSEALGEIKIEEAKYYTGVQEPASARSAMRELEGAQFPARYEEDTLVLQIRDPWWGYVYWDINPATLRRLGAELPQEFSELRWVLRSYDVSFIRFDGTNAHRFFDTTIDAEAKNWYLNFGSPGASWCVDLGVILADGRFVRLLRSNVISLPLAGPSWITDEEWMIPEDEFRRLYGMSIGLGPNVSSSPGKVWQERMKQDVSSAGWASMGVSSPVANAQARKKGGFWLRVDAELIVYGATEPDAKLTVQGRPVKLREDGTFSLRFALPDGEQVIPVVASSARIRQTRSITPIVARKTQRSAT